MNRPPSDTDVAYWINVRLPNPRVDIPTFFLSSDEYAAVVEARKARVCEPGLRR